MTAQAKIGLLIPSTNVVLEPDLKRLAAGMPLSVHAARMRHDLRLAPAERLTRMADDARVVVLDLAAAQVDVVVYGVTSGSFFFGRERDAAFQSELARLAGCPAVSTSTAVVEALSSLGVHRVAVVTPYADDLNDHLPPYLVEHGFEVAAMCTGATDRPDLVAADEVVDLARQAWRSDADALFISCTGLPTLDLIEPLERELGAPVITSNQASYWAAVRRIGVSSVSSGAGRLLA